MILVKDEDLEMLMTVMEPVRVGTCLATAHVLVLSAVTFL